MPTVVLTGSARRDISGLPAVVQARVAAKIADLANPNPGMRVKALKGNFKGSLRVRVGAYRIVFTVDGDTITITRVEHRSAVYD